MGDIHTYVTILEYPFCFFAVHLCRRLCPGLAFFQNPSLHTLDVLTNSKNRFETLRQRVEHSMLKAQTVSTNWVGINIAMVTKTKGSEFDDSRRYAFNVLLFCTLSVGFCHVV